MELNDLCQSISEMPERTLTEHIASIRMKRRTYTPPPKKRKEEVKKERKKKERTDKTLSKLTRAQITKLLLQLEEEEDE